MASSAVAVAEAPSGGAPVTATPGIGIIYPPPEVRSTCHSRHVQLRPTALVCACVCGGPHARTDARSVFSLVWLRWVRAAACCALPSHTHARTHTCA
jgi:hypothetical protein